jgi:hypothetical protein
MITEYLILRKNILEKQLKENKDKLENNMIAIVDSKNKIAEIDSQVDEASEMFSVKAREDSGFKNQEINELEIHITAYITENEDIERRIKFLSDEINTVDECLEETQNVSRETDVCNNEKNIEGYIEKDNSIIQKLKLCKKLVDIDSNRVKVEIDNIIQNISSKTNNIK